MIKHWLTNHQDLENPPKFKIKVVGKFQDSFTRQVSEAVRIELRGEHILNSKSEFSRCKIPRLVIDQEEWRKYKKKEVKELEPVIVQNVVEVDENGLETAEMLDEEKELGQLESKETKRKQKDGSKPPAKRKRLENLIDWGEQDEVEENPERAKIANWLVSRGTVRSCNEVGLTESNENPSKRMRQLELEFAGGFGKPKRIEPEVKVTSDDDPSTPKGWKVGTLMSSTLVKKKSLKQLRKENMKITDWMKKSTVDEGKEKEKVDEKENEAHKEIEEQMEVDDPEIIERRIRRDQRKNAWMLRTIAKKVSVDILEELVSEIPGRAVAGNILDEMLEMMNWRVSLKIAWSILESDKKLQRMITWRIENQRLEEIWLAEAMKKEERLKEAKSKTLMFRNRVVVMDVDMMEEDESMVME